MKTKIAAVVLAFGAITLVSAGSASAALPPKPWLHPAAKVGFVERHAKPAYHVATWTPSSSMVQRSR